MQPMLSRTEMKRRKRAIVQRSWRRPRKNPRIPSMRKCYHINSIQLLLLFHLVIFIHSGKSVLLHLSSKSNCPRMHGWREYKRSQFLHFLFGKMFALWACALGQYNLYSLPIIIIIGYHHTIVIVYNETTFDITPRYFRSNFRSFSFCSLLLSHSPSFVMCIFHFCCNFIFHLAAFDPKWGAQYEPAQDKFHLLLRQTCHNFSFSLPVVLCMFPL